MLKELEEGKKAINTCKTAIEEALKKYNAQSEVVKRTRERYSKIKEEYNYAEEVTDPAAALNLSFMEDKKELQH